MNTFKSNAAKGAEAVAMFARWARRRTMFYDGRYVRTDKGPLSRMLQTTVGDIVYNKDDVTVAGLEVKREDENRTGNLFLEAWSNRSRGTPGWLVTLDTDYLIYIFWDSDEMYGFNFRKLKRWALERMPSGKYRMDEYADRYPLRRQNKHDQLNDTWGWCVGIREAMEYGGGKGPEHPRFDLGEYDAPSMDTAHETWTPIAERPRISDTNRNLLLFDITKRV